jgi:transposase
MLSDSEALIAQLELAIEKLRRELRGKRSERTARLIDQMELQLEELVMAATEDEVAAQALAANTSSVRSFTCKRPVRRPWPEDVERKRVVLDPPSTCACCGGSRLSRLGEDVNETLEEIPRRFIVIETVREKFTCRDCEKISQTPAPFHATPRGFIGPHLLATILFDKLAMHSPLNRVSNRFKCEGKNHLVQREIGNGPPEPGLLRFQLLQTLHLVALQTTVFGPPPVVCNLRHPIDRIASAIDFPCAFSTST